MASEKALKLAHEALKFGDWVGAYHDRFKHDEAAIATLIDIAIAEAVGELVAVVTQARELISYEGQDKQPKAVAEANLNQAFKILRGIEFTHAKQGGE